MKKFIGVLVLSILSQTGFAIELNNEEMENLKVLLSDIQKQSFKEDKIFCGYIGYSEGDQFIASPPQKVAAGNCELAEPPFGFDLIASYHTQGKFTQALSAESPSFDAMYDLAEKTTGGFITTPGGRVWHINTYEGISQMVCDSSCVTADPQFSANLSSQVKNSYTLAQ